VTYYEDPRRFSSRVIGLSFQGPRGRAFLPSGSRYVVSLVFAVKDFAKLFSATPDSDFSPSCGLSARRRGVRSGRRCMPSIVSFGKIFCRYFARAKFLRDFQGFRPVGTRLLYSDRASVGIEMPRSAWLGLVSWALSGPCHAEPRARLCRLAPGESPVSAPGLDESVVGASVC
jgi:hypothetical protein